MRENKLSHADQCDLNAIILTYNEEKNIRQALDSAVGWAKEVLVVDSYSTNSTIETCRTYEERSVNEHIAVSSAVRRLNDGPIHEDRNGLNTCLHKHVRHAQLEAIVLRKRHDTRPLPGSQASKRRWQKERIYNKLQRFTRCILFFCYHTFSRCGILDGLRVLTYHLLHSLWHRFTIDPLDCQAQVRQANVGICMPPEEPDKLNEAIRRPLADQALRAVYGGSGSECLARYHDRRVLAQRRPKLFQRLNQHQNLFKNRKTRYESQQSIYLQSETSPHSYARSCSSSFDRLAVGQQELTVKRNSA